MKTRLLPAAFAVVLAALIGIHPAGMSVEAASPAWSIAVHLDYADGTAYDYVFATGVPAPDVASTLAECGRSHAWGSAVRYHCYPIPE